MGFLSKAIGGLLGTGSGEVASAANQGFDYLKQNELVGQAQDMGGQAMGLMSGLLGLGGDQQAAEEAFSQFRDSTGYDFRLQQGMDAITGSRAAAGVLNSGAASKELMRFGQDLGSQEFQNYLNQLGGVQETGLGAAYNTGSAGSSAAGGVAAATRQGQADAGSTLGGIVRTGLSIFGF